MGRSVIIIIEVEVVLAACEESGVPLALEAPRTQMLSSQGESGALSVLPSPCGGSPLVIWDEPLPCQTVAVPRAIAGVHLSHKTAGILSTVFDLGGVTGGILAGFISDAIEARAVTSVIFLLLSIPALISYRIYGSISMITNVMLMFLSGLLVNGPYSLITTAVAADLGTQSLIKGNSRALATVTAIIDGTGSVGAALGPLLAGYISTTGWNGVFFMLTVSISIAAMLLIQVVKSEIKEKMSEGKWIRWCLVVAQ